jgi:hypothetical protein
MTFDRRTFDRPTFDAEPVFVVGAPRSGTTWLAELLQAHPSTVGIPQGETQMFWALAPLWLSAERRRGPGIRTLVTHDELVTAVRAFCDALFEAARATQGPGATHFIEKTPAHAVHVARMHEVYPDAWFVHIVRDGRDVVRSIARFDLEELRPIDIPTAAAEWDRLNRLILAEAPRLDRYRMVRYEELVDAPVDGACGLLEWMGLPCDEGVRTRVGGAAGTPVSQHAGKGPVGPGKWRDDLSDAQLSTIYRIAGPLLVELGYLDANELTSWRRLAVYRRTAALDALRDLATRASAPVRRAVHPLRHQAPWASRGQRRVY